MRDGGRVHRRVGGAGDRGMDHDGVFKAFFGHDVLRADALLQQLEQLDNPMQVLMAEKLFSVETRQI